MFENENAFGAISDKEHIAIVQIDSQMQELKLCLQCPFLSKCKKGAIKDVERKIKNST